MNVFECLNELRCVIDINIKCILFRDGIVRDTKRDEIALKSLV